MRFKIGPAVLAAALAAAVLALASCSGVRGGYQAVVALDEAFVAAYPSLAAALERPQAFAGILGLALGRAPKPVVVSLTQGAGLALDAVRKAEAGASRPVALVASPLIAAALLGGGVWEGSPPLLVPEWRGKPAQGMRTAATDPISAYRRAGAALGTYLAGIAREGGSPACGILFSEGPARPRSALQAFAEGYSETSGGVRLLVRELPASSSGASPDQNPAGTNEAPPGDARSASAKPLGPEESVREMLGADLRALFIALGPETVVAVRAASRPGLALGADYPDPSGLKALAFRIAPDSDGIVRALARELDALGEGGIEAPGIAVPAKLEVESAASALRAGDRTLAAILRSAGSRDQR